MLHSLRKLCIYPAITHFQSLAYSILREYFILVGSPRKLLFTLTLTRIHLTQGDKKQTNYHRAMLSDLVKGIIPSSWRRYTVPRGCTVIQWITDFSERIKQLQQVSQLVSRGAQQIKVSASCLQHSRMSKKCYNFFLSCRLSPYGLADY